MDGHKNQSHNQAQNVHRPNRPAPRPKTNANMQPNRQTPKNTANSGVRQGAQLRPPKGLSDNLRSQTPLNRQMRQRTTPVEPGTARRATVQQQFKVRTTDKKQRKRIRSIALIISVLALLVYAIFVPIGFIIFKATLNGTITNSGKEYVYQLGSSKDVYSKKIYSTSKIKRGGTYYIDMDSIADYCSLTTTGSDVSMRYVVKDSEESIEFVLGQSIAYINGVPERTGADVFVSGGRVYVPLNFAVRCFNGLNITLDTENYKITIEKQTDQYGKYLELSFPYKLPSNTKPINFGELPIEIQNQIIASNTTEPDAPENNGADGN